MSFRKRGLLIERYEYKDIAGEHGSVTGQPEKPPRSPYPGLQMTFGPLSTCETKQMLIRLTGYI
jgi:hypothetical protein